MNGSSEIIHIETDEEGTHWGVQFIHAADEAWEGCVTGWYCGDYEKPEDDVVINLLASTEGPFDTREEAERGLEEMRKPIDTIESYEGTAKKILAKIKAGQLDARDLGIAMEDKWDQDFPVWLLETAINMPTFRGKPMTADVVKAAVELAYKQGFKKGCNTQSLATTGHECHEGYLTPAAEEAWEADRRSVLKDD